MQLTTNVTIVDFFPEAYIADEGVKRFQKRVTWRSNGLKSYSTVTMLTAKNEWESRIANGAEVTDYNTEKMPASEYMPMSCWLCFLKKIMSLSTFCSVNSFPKPTLTWSIYMMMIHAAITLNSNNFWLNYHD